MKTRDELQRAHDILHIVAVGEVPGVFDPETTAHCHLAHDAIAWALGFECGVTFEENLEKIHAEMERRGYHLTGSGETKVRPPGWGVQRRRA